jgi:hypothetical protein
MTANPWVHTGRATFWFMVLTVGLVLTAIGSHGAVGTVVWATAGITLTVTAVGAYSTVINR